MSAQLDHDRPGLRTPLPAAPASPSRPPRSDSDRGLSLLLSFVGALAVMVADVLVIGAVAESWVLIPGFVVLLLMTVLVFDRIMRLLADNGETPARRHEGTAS